MGPLAAAILLAAAPDAGTQVTEAGGIRVTAAVVANDYRWTVTNLDAAPVAVFQMPHHNCFNHTVPEGWQLTYENEELFRAWTDDPLRSIDPGESAEFSGRAAARGANLGSAPLTLELRLGRPVEMAAVWAPSPRPRGAVGLVAGGMIALALVHAGLVRRRERPEQAGGAG